MCVIICCALCASQFVITLIDVDEMLWIDAKLLVPGSPTIRAIRGAKNTLENMPFGNPQMKDILPVAGGPQNLNRGNFMQDVLEQLYHTKHSHVVKVYAQLLK
ncbi:hypothetical protein CRM22_006193 [Opisthorchis felineus]|uniref:Uncharacterized protein n=1 Tax=Opisthorchis felineus TaxID=147828 RepID=A0A4S2LM90_OPIFE|nr:hypothetical protein CRM22_006193 [Opisthorchis felineus]